MKASIRRLVFTDYAMAVLPEDATTCCISFSFLFTIYTVL